MNQSSYVYHQSHGKPAQAGNQLWTFLHNHSDLTKSDLATKTPPHINKANDILVARYWLGSLCQSMFLALKFDCTEKKWYTSLQKAKFSAASFIFITQMMWGDSCA